MGSRLMHAAIAKQLMTKFSQLDMAFLIGNEAPDVDKISEMSKDETHYLVPSNRGTRRVDLRLFYKSIQKRCQIRLPWAITHIYWLTRFGLQTSS